MPAELGAEQRFHRIGRGQGDAAGMAQPRRGGRGIERGPRRRGQARDRGFRRRFRPYQREGMQRAVTLGELPGLRLRSTARQGGDGGRHRARLRPCIGQAIGGEQPGEVGEADAQPLCAAMAEDVEHSHRDGNRRGIAGGVEAAPGIEEGRQVEHEARFVLPVAPDLDARRATTRQQQGAQGDRERIRLLGAVEQAEAAAARGDAADPALGERREDHRPGAGGEGRERLRGAVVPSRGECDGARRGVGVGAAALPPKGHTVP